MNWQSLSADPSVSRRFSAIRSCSTSSALYLSTFLQDTVQPSFDFIVPSNLMRLDLGPMKLDVDRLRITAKFCFISTSVQSTCFFNVSEKSYLALCFFSQFARLLSYSAYNAGLPLVFLHQSAAWTSHRAGLGQLLCGQVFASLGRTRQSKLIRVASTSWNWKPMTTFLTNSFATTSLIKAIVAVDIP